MECVTFPYLAKDEVIKLTNTIDFVEDVDRLTGLQKLVKSYRLQKKKVL